LHWKITPSSSTLSEGVIIDPRFSPIHFEEKGGREILTPITSGKKLSQKRFPPPQAPVFPSEQSINNSGSRHETS